MKLLPTPFPPRTHRRRPIAHRGSLAASPFPAAVSAPIAPVTIESLESRRLMADVWGATPRLIRQDSLDFLHPSIRGQGQTIAVIDTGIDYTHPQLGGGLGDEFKIIAGHDFVDDDSDPMDTDGHGTAVAGVIASDSFTSNGFTYRGLAPDAKLVALRIAPDTSAVPLERIEEALQWVLTKADEYTIRTVNLSFGFGRFTSSFVEPTIGDELQELADRGIAFVASSGNDGTQDGFGIDYPAADGNAFSVGSVNGSDVISEFTQRSSNLDLLAPGEGVRSTGLNGQIVTLSGTSFAAPAVAGTLALMRQIDGGFTLTDLRSMLRAAMPTNYDGDDEIGDTTDRLYLRLDALSAVNIAIQRKAGTPPQQAAVGVGGNDADIAFDRYGVLHFVYWNAFTRRMEYAVRNTNGRWSAPSGIDDRTSVGENLSMKLDSYGRPMLAYLDGPAGHLRFGQLLGGQWSLQSLDTARITGLNPSLAIDGSDRLHIAYYRKTSGDLRLMTRDIGGNWKRQTIASDGNTGLTPVMQFDRTQNLTIAYVDGGRDLLKFTRREDDGTWETQTVQKTVGDAAYISVAFDDGNRARMSYYETKTADLLYATQSGSVSWSAKRLASRGATGLYTNLRLDDDGMAQILYWDRRTDSLIRFAQGATKWTGTIVADDTGRFALATLSNFNGSWTYAAVQTTAVKLVFGEL